MAGGNYGGKVAACYVVGEDDQGDVIGSWTVGGLVGDNEGTIIASYANVYVRGAASPTGGLVGYNAPGAKIIASYSLGRIGGAPVVWPHVDRNDGGLVGINAAASTAIEASYYDRDSSGLSSGGDNVSSTTVKRSRELRSPVAAEGIYAAWSGLNVDDTSSTVMGVLTLDDDDPWDFGTNVDYPVLRGVSARYRNGNAAGIRAQRPPVDVLVTLSQDTERKFEGEEAEYTAALSAHGAGAVTINWALEFTGVGMGHAEAADFSGVTRGEVVLAGTDSKVFTITVRDENRPEERETFRVRLSNPRGLERLRLDAASSAVVSVIARGGGIDYDFDGDNLIEVRSAVQLDAIRYDLGGEGMPTEEPQATTYSRAFPFFDESRTCPGTCIGYELSSDVDLSSMDGWTPIGGGYFRASPEWTGWNERPESIRYNAVFEGNGHVVRNMTITRAAGSARYDHVGLFGVLGPRGRIRSVGVENANVNAPHSVRVGALAGTNMGRIATSYAVGGVVTGSWAVGGLVGEMIGGTVSSTVVASYSNVAVHGRERRVGGLIGSTGGGNKSIVSASYTIGIPTVGQAQVGGLAGYAPSLDLQSSYFDRQRAGLSACCGPSVPSSDNAPARTSAQLRIPTEATGLYTGWDQLNLDGVDQLDDDDLNDDAPWDFGTWFQYPVLVLGGDLARQSAQRTLQRRAQPPTVLMPKLEGRATVVEGERVTYVVSLPGALPPGVNAGWSWSAGGAAVDNVLDFDDAEGRVFMASGQSSASFTVDVVMDGEAEFAEVFEVSLGDALLTGALGNLLPGVPSSAVRTTIAANEFDQATVAAPSMVSEGTTMTFTVTLSGGADRAVTVEYEIVAVSETLTPEDLGPMEVADRNGSNIVEVNALPVTGSMTIGTDGTARVRLKIVDEDPAGEGVERFRLRLTGCPDCGSVHPAEIGVPSSAEVAISRTPLVVSAQVYLEGAYDASSGAMSTNLTRVLPSRQPYDAAPWHYRTTTTVPHVPAYGLGGLERPIVDWVLVELRAAAPGAGAGAALPTTDGRAAGLLLADGRIAGINEGASSTATALRLDGVRIEAGFVPGSEIYVVIHHRNHLPVMSATSATSAGCAADYCADFRGRQSYVGCPQLRRAGAPYVMVAGDVNRSGVVSWGDDDFRLTIAGNREARYDERVSRRATNYLVDADLDFSGRITSDDYRLIVANNLLSSEECAP